MSIHIKVTSYPRLCNSTLLGTTREISQQNGTVQSQKDIVCSLEDCLSISVNYTVSNIDPLMNYIFIADILDYFNNSKTKIESYFSEFKLM